MTLSSHLCKGLSDSSLLTDKSGSGVLLYLHSGWTDCNRKYVWTGKARRRSRLFGCCHRWIIGLLCAGWMSAFAVCLCCLYVPRLSDSIHRGSQGAQLGPGNDCDYAKCPLCLSFPLIVMDMVCNGVEMWPHCSLSSIRLCCLLYCRVLN